MGDVLENNIDQETSTKKEKNIVVGFWLRLVSDFLDVIVLGLLGILITIPLKNVFYQIGENGLFIGLIITFLYTGILQSYIGNGQSIAKKILKIQVLDINGKYLSLQKSFLRYTVIAFVFYNSWIITALTSILPFLNNVIFQTIYSFFIIFLFLGVTVLIGLHPLKRGFHDLIAKSIVVRKNKYNKEKIDELDDKSKIRKAYKILFVCSIILIIILSFVVIKVSQSSPHIGELTKIQKEIGVKTELTNISVIHNTHTFTNSEGLKTITRSLNINTFLNKKKYDDETIKDIEIKKAINILTELYPEIVNIDVINIQIRTGYNIGINSYYISETSSFDINGNPLGDKKEESKIKLGS